MALFPGLFSVTTFCQTAFHYQEKQLQSWQNDSLNIYQRDTVRKNLPLLNIYIGGISFGGGRYGIQYRITKYLSLDFGYGNLLVDYLHLSYTWDRKYDFWGGVNFKDDGYLNVGVYFNYYTYKDKDIIHDEGILIYPKIGFFWFDRKNKNGFTGFVNICYLIGYNIDKKELAPMQRFLPMIDIGIGYSFF